MATKKPAAQKTVEALVHDEAKRKNIPTAEHQSVVGREDKKSIKIKYPRNQDLDPQLIWRGKDEQDWSDLVVNAPPLYIQEKIHPKALIDELLRESKQSEHDAGMTTADLFADFDGISKEVDKTEFYSHDQNWSNRMILGDSLQVMASLAEREGLRGQVQCIYFDPPYGIKFNSNFQWSTTSRDVKDGSSEHITREPEQVKAFRDTWRDGIHSYLTYLRDRLTVARDLLTDSGSIFVQIGDENVHRVKVLLDEVFGADNALCIITLLKSTGVIEKSDSLHGSVDYIIQYAKNKDKVKYRPLFKAKSESNSNSFNRYMSEAGDIESVESKNAIRVKFDNLKKQGPGSKYDINFKGNTFDAGRLWWGFSQDSMERLIKANRIASTNNNLYRIVTEQDYPVSKISTLWDDVANTPDLIYVVQTNTKVIERCVILSTDPGDLVLDPTCGSGTTAFVAEQFGRRWITIDTSRVALALARTRIMGAKYPYYLLADSKEGRIKEAEITGSAPSTQMTYGSIKQGFVYERVPHITLKAIANNSEIDVIWEKWQKIIESCVTDFNKELGLHTDKAFKEWDLPKIASSSWPERAKNVFQNFQKAKIDKQKEIMRAISSKSEFEYLYDKPYEDRSKVRVAGPFTLESLSPHRMLGVDENDNLIDDLSKEDLPKQSFMQMILDNLKLSGVQQAHKDGKIEFSTISHWPGKLVCAEGRFEDSFGDNAAEKRAAIFIGPEFGTVQRADLVEAAREAGDAGFDTLIACAFNYEAHATDLNKLGSIPILKARMNADLHMSEDLKNTGKGNLFVVFGEPDIEIIEDGQFIKVKVNGVDVFKPQTGEVVSDGADGIACWFVDTDYNEESFFVRQAYFLGANDPYSSLKATLKAEINADAWASLNSDVSRLFPRPKSGRIAIKVINHLGDEVMKVFRV